jgi:RND superfamily putative drug exporter
VGSGMVTPALLTIVGCAVSWPSMARPGVPRVGLWGRIAGWIIHRPAPTLAVAPVR